jgi:hypothetical protein
LQPPRRLHNTGPNANCRTSLSYGHFVSPSHPSHPSHPTLLSRPSHPSHPPHPSPGRTRHAEHARDTDNTHADSLGTSPSSVNALPLRKLLRWCAHTHSLFSLLTSKPEPGTRQHFILRSVHPLLLDPSPIQPVGEEGVLHQGLHPFLQAPVDRTLGPADDTRT